MGETKLGQTMGDEEELQPNITYASEERAAKINRKRDKKQRRIEEEAIMEEFDQDDADDNDEPLSQGTHLSMREIRNQANLEAIMKGQRKLFKEMKFTKKKLKETLNEMRDYVSSSFYTLAQSSEDDLSETSSDNIVTPNKVYNQYKKKQAKRKTFASTEPERKINNKLKFV